MSYAFVHAFENHIYKERLDKLVVTNFNDFIGKLLFRLKKWESKKANTLHARILMLLMF